MSVRRGVVLVFLLIALAVFASLAGILLLFSAAGSAPPVPSNASLYLRIRAPFSEIESSSVLTPFVVAPPTLRATIELIQRAQRDSRVKTLVILPEAAGALWGQLQEVRAAIQAFRDAGKQVTAFLEYGGAGEYFLASAANRILMVPAGQLDLSGLATYELFFRGTLDKIGVFPDLLHIGEYKTAANTFTERTFTPAHREMAQALNRDFYDQLVRAIASGRKRSEAEVRHAIDRGPYLPAAAQAAGLIDGLAYDDQVDDDPPVRGTRRLEGDEYGRSAAGFGSGPRIALLYASGTIASGGSAFDGPGGLVVGSDTFVGWIRKVRADDGIKAIVVRVDSPGGSAIASEVIWRELMLARAIKPVIVSMGDVAASGGYYIALPAHAIVAQPGTITGSIGVVTGKFVVKDGLGKLGVTTETVSDGRLAEIYSPMRPFTPEERQRIEEQMQSTYELFVSRVATARASTNAKIDNLAQGRVWTGRQAHELGLVDELGGLDRAIALAKDRANIGAARDVRLVVYPQRRSFYEIVANPLGAAAEAGAALAARTPASRVIDDVAGRLRLFRRGEVLAVLPNVYWR